MKKAEFVRCLLHDSHALLCRRYVIYSPLYKFVLLTDVQFLAPFFFQLAQPIRLLLNYVGEEFDDVQYEQGDG